MARILFISEVEAYVGKDSDVPESYARVAADPGLELWHASPRAVLDARDCVAACRVRPGARFEELVNARTAPVPIDAIDLVFDRVLKPLPDGYLEALVRWRERLEFVNDPLGILEQLDPRFLLRAAGRFMPPTIVTADVAEAQAFFERHAVIVAKRPNSCGGRAVFRLRQVASEIEVSGLARATRRYASFGRALASLGTRVGEPVTFVRYLPRVVEGDLRVITLDGHPLGAYVRRGDGWIQNVGAGGHCRATDLTREVSAMIDATHRAYGSIGVRVLGYDFLVNDDGRRVVSEINAGNTGGIFRLERLTGRPTGQLFVDWLKSGLRTCSRAARAS